MRKSGMDTVPLGILSFNKFKINAYTLKKKSKLSLIRDKRMGNTKHKKTVILKKNIKGSKFSELKGLRRKKENTKKRVNDRTRITSLFRKKKCIPKTPKARKIKINMKTYGLKTSKLMITPKSTKISIKEKKRKIKKGNQRLLRAIFQNREIRASICNEEEIPKKKSNIEYEKFDETYEVKRISNDQLKRVSKRIQTPPEMHHILCNPSLMGQVSLPNVYFMGDKDSINKIEEDLSSADLKCVIVIHTDLKHFNCHRKVVEILGMENFQDMIQLLGIVVLL